MDFSILSINGETSTGPGSQLNNPKVDFVAPKSNYLRRFYITRWWKEKYYWAYFNENCPKKGQKWFPVL